MCLNVNLRRLDHADLYSSKLFIDNIIVILDMFKANLKLNLLQVKTCSKIYLFENCISNEMYVCVKFGKYAIKIYNLISIEMFNLFRKLEVPYLAYKVTSFILDRKVSPSALTALNAASPFWSINSFSFFDFNFSRCSISRYIT